MLQCRRCHDLIEAKKARHGIIVDFAGPLQYRYERWSDGDMDFVEAARVVVVVDGQRGHLIPMEGPATESRVSQPRASGTDSSVAEPPAGVRSDATEGVDSVVVAPAGFAGAGGEDRVTDSPPPAPAGILSEDWRTLSDDELQAKYEAADQMQGVAFLIKCKATHAFRDNHVRAWGESWKDQAIERFNISRRTCASYANIWEIYATRCTSLDIAPLTDSRSLMAFIGQKAVKDGAVAMEAAVAHHAEFAEPPTVAALAHRLGEGRQERERHECPACGAEHTVRRDG